MFSELREYAKHQEALCLPPGRVPPPAASVGSAGSEDNNGQGNSGFVKVRHGHGM